MPTFRVDRMEQNNDPQNAKNEFAEYMWMEDQEGFDRAVFNEIEEENYIRSSIEMLLDEEERETVYFDKSGTGYSQQAPEEELYHQEQKESFYPNNDSTGLNQTHGFENLTLLQAGHQFPPQNATSYPNTNGQQFSHGAPTNPQFSHQMYRPTPGQHNMNFGAARNNHSNAVSTSKLNPNATPFFLNPEAKEFVPKGSNDR